MTQFNAIAQKHIDGEVVRGEVAQMIRKAITSKQWDQVGTAYGQLLEAFGKRARVKGTKDFTPSTPADTFYTQVQSITANMECGKLKPVLIELDDGSERWGLEPVQSRAGSKRTLKKLEDIRESHAAILEGRTYEEKVSELEAFAELLGVKMDRAKVSQIKTKTAKKKPMSAGEAVNHAPHAIGGAVH